ncbi:MAG: galactose ABC transporter substrate-binding protein [Lachnospiraceae bacterium]|nr:galactose ABC transporter substrate-binding protein [Lachnospiraceae bacterium]
MKKRFVRTVLVGISLSMSLALAGCGEKKQVENRQLRVGICLYDQKDTFVSALADCFREDLTKMGLASTDVTVDLRDAEKSQQMQDDQVGDLIDEGVDVLCINPVDRASLSDCIEQARSADVPIIFFNREPVAEDLGQWDRLYYVGADARESGKLQGQVAADYVKDHPEVDKNGDGRIQYVILEGQPGHQDSIIRTEKVEPAMTDEGISVEKLGTEVANWSRAQAISRMQTLISEYHSSIEMVLANNDDMAMGAADAYKKLNVTETDVPPIFGVDGTKAGLNALIDGAITATVYNDKESQAMMMATLAVRAARGEDTSSLPLENGKAYYAHYYKVTSDNVKDFTSRQEKMSLEDVLSGPA